MIVIFFTLLYLVIMSNLSMFYIIFMSVHIDSDEKRDYVAVSIFNMWMHQLRNKFIHLEHMDKRKELLFYRKAVLQRKLSGNRKNNIKNMQSIDMKDSRDAEQKITKTKLNVPLYTASALHHDRFRIFDVRDLTYIDDHVQYLIQDYQKIYCVRDTSLYVTETDMARHPECFNAKNFLVVMLFFMPNNAYAHRQVTDIRYCYDCKDVDIFFDSQSGCNVGVKRYVSNYKSNTLPIDTNTEIIRSVLNAGGYLFEEDDVLECM